MKKNLAKIFASAGMVVAIILIMILIITAFGGIDQADFDNQLVKGLLITLAILYFAIGVFTLILLFVSAEATKEVTIRVEQGGSVRIAAGVVSRLVKKACKEIEGVQCKKVTLIGDDYGVRLKINVKVTDKDVLEAETYIRTLIEDMFYSEFGFKFSSIEVKVMQLTPKYKADVEEIEARVAQKLADIKAHEAAEEGETVAPTAEQDALSEELDAVAHDADDEKSEDADDGEQE